MILDEIIINIDFEDRTGLEYEIFEVCEKNGIDKISMVVLIYFRGCPLTKEQPLLLFGACHALDELRPFVS